MELEKFETNCVDWANPDNVIDYIIDNAIYFDANYDSTKLANYRIINKFTYDKLIEHGYTVDMNVGAEFNAEDKDNFCKYLIGQAMAIYQVYNISPLLHKFYEEYKEKFST